MDVRTIEFEGVGGIENISDKYEIWLHFPFILMSSGRICEFSGINDKIHKRYFPCKCNCQCKDLVGKATSHGISGFLYQRGNAIYFQRSFQSMEVYNSIKRLKVIMPNHLES